MLKIAPTLASAYQLIYSGDPALEPAPTDPAEREAWEHRRKIARQTGDWLPIVLPGHSPTVFTMRHIPGMVWRDVGLNPTLRHAGHVVRLALIKIENPDIQLELEDDPVMGRVCSAKVINLLDQLSLKIVNELSNRIVEHQEGVIDPL